MNRVDLPHGILPAFAVFLSVLLFCATAGADGLLRIAVISDLNGRYGSVEYAEDVDRAVERIVALDPDLVISTGDMVAGQRRSQLSEPEVESMWAAFHRHVSEPLAAAGIPLAVTPGNHDGSAYPGFEAERRIYGEQWAERQPRVSFVDSANYPYHYAFAIDDVLFVSIDATVVGKLPAAQSDWLGRLLAAEGTRYRYRVLFSHLPLFPFAVGRDREVIGDPALQSLLEAMDVDLYLSGHHHAFFPGSYRGTAFVSQACLGGGARRLKGQEQRSPKGFTLLRFDGGGIAVASLRAPGFSETVAWHDLPERLVAGDVEMLRADLAGSVSEMRDAW